MSLAIIFAFFPNNVFGKMEVIMTELPYIHLHSSTSKVMLRANSQHDQLPVSLIARLVEHCTGIAEVMGLNPVQA